MNVRRLALGLAIPSCSEAQQPVRLSEPEAAFPEPFTLVASVRELSDGRLLVLDRRDRLVVLVDFRTGKGTPVGREGTGPGEYSQPGRLFPLRGDTSAIYDGPARRFLVVTPDGKAGENFRMDAATGGGGRGGGVPKGSDQLGRVFTEGSPYAAGELRAADSTPVTRFARGAAKGDTLAYIHLDKESVQIRALEGGGYSVSNGVRAFALRDDWAALPDGGVAIVRVSDYHIDWISPTGVRTAGKPVITARIAVTEADKDNARKERLAAMRSATARSRPGGPPNGPPNVLAGLPELTFPEFKPPFEVGQVFARPNGDVWVLRSRVASDEVPVYDVFTKAGGLTGRVAFPRRTRVIGFGRTAIYTVRLDDDDLQYVERWRVDR